MASIPEGKSRVVKLCNCYYDRQVVYIYLCHVTDIRSFVPRPSLAPVFDRLQDTAILQAIRNWSWRRPGNEAITDIVCVCIDRKCQIHANLISFVQLQNDE